LVDATLFQKENPLITRDSSKDNEKLDSPTCSIAAGEGKSPEGSFFSMDDSFVNLTKLRFPKPPLKLKMAL
jgi:hypothetical protein